MTIEATMPIPTVPGVYWWHEWQAAVTVYYVSHRKRLYVTPPGGVEIPITKRIAGGFVYLSPVPARGDS